MKNLTVNPDIIILQSQLHTPTYFGVGKWAIFNSATRKGFLAVGKDKLPEVIQILLEVLSVKSNSYSISLNTDPEKIRRLVKSDILIEDSEHNDTNSCFLDYYRKISFDYPFQDYFDTDWRSKDRVLMTAYTKQSPRPENFTKREQNDAICLEDVNLSELPDVPLGKRFTSNMLAWLLKFGFGEVGKIEGYLGPWVRKTSPSGGGRHPTEAILVLPENYFDDIQAGTYHYDPAFHSLVPTEYEDYEQQLRNFCPPNEIGILIVSSVARPMWRYRDTRALRPTIIDSGHIIETLSLILSFWGISCALTNPPVPSYKEQSAWLNSPPIAFLCTGHTKASVQYPVMKQYFEDESKWITNSTLYFSFQNNEFYANVLFPQVRSLQIDGVEFCLLQHCLFSRRQDRANDTQSILKEFGVSGERFAKLITNTLLLPYDIGLSLYKQVLPWAHHNWYLSLLAYLNALVDISGREKESKYQLSSLSKNYSKQDVINAFLQRKTTRRFKQDAVSSADLYEILHVADQQRLGFDASEVKLYVAILNVNGIESGLYMWNSFMEKLDVLASGVSYDLIRKLTIGQECAGKGSFTIWISKAIQHGHPGEYMLDLIKLGRIAQRICVTASHLNLGVFLTPALNDAETGEFLKIVNPIDYIFYTLTIGLKADG